MATILVIVFGINSFIELYKNNFKWNEMSLLFLIVVGIIRIFEEVKKKQ